MKTFLVSLLWDSQAEKLTAAINCIIFINLEVCVCVCVIHVF